MPAPLLELENLRAGYGRATVVWDVSLTVAEGSITALLGPNGAGKSTLLWAAMGGVRPTAGTVRFAGEEVTRLPPHRKVELGMALAPEGKHLFREMTVAENLAMGAYSRRARSQAAESLEFVCGLFPRLRERLRQRAGSFSGGEQQMLNLARALMTRPRLLILDEPSQGLAPKLVDEVYATIERLRRETGLTIVLIDQNAVAALALADYAYVLRDGLIEMHGPAKELAESPKIRQAYLGL